MHVSALLGSALGFTHMQAIPRRQVYPVDSNCAPRPLRKVDGVGMDMGTHENLPGYHLG